MNTTIPKGSPFSMNVLPHCANVPRSEFSAFKLTDML